MLQIPLLRAGREYESLERATLRDFRTGEPMATISQANAGLIAHDLLVAERNQRALQDLGIAALLQLCKRAGQHFLESELPVGNQPQSADEYVRCLSATTGMPHALCRKNMLKIHGVLDNMEVVLSGLTRGLDLSLLDSGWTSSERTPLSYFCETPTLGAILPNNSPGVHSLWVPSIAMKVPLVLRPGREEPWTPLRIAQAFLAAGCPREAFSFYPSDHAGASTILLRTGRSMLFGDESTVRPWKSDPRIQIHGPGWSKVIIAEDQIDSWQQHLDTLVISVLENGGRSCVNASGIWVPSRGREIAEALAQRLATVQARAMDDPDAQIAAFPNRKFAQRINEMIESKLNEPGAEDLTAKLRGARMVEAHGAAYMLPTVIWCDSPEHPLANTEFLFPFVSVVEAAPQEELLERMGHSLVVTALTEDKGFIRRLFSSSNVERLNIGAIPTCRIAWDQPHEGNLFEHLYRRRALQLI